MTAEDAAAPAAIRKPAPAKRKDRRDGCRLDAGGGGVSVMVEAVRTGAESHAVRAGDVHRRAIAAHTKWMQYVLQVSLYSLAIWLMEARKTFCVEVDPTSDRR